MRGYGRNTPATKLILMTRTELRVTVLIFIFNQHLFLVDYNAFSGNIARTDIVWKFAPQIHCHMELSGGRKRVGGGGGESLIGRLDYYAHH